MIFKHNNPDSIKISHRFAPLIVSGRKKQQIVRTLKFAPGAIIVFELHEIPAKEHGCDLWQEKCTAVQTVKFSPSGVFMDGVMLTPAAAMNFARGEGFIDFQELVDWYFAYHQAREFEGFVLRW